MIKQELLKSIHYDEEGLVPVILQDIHSKAVRRLTYMNEEALIKTLETGKVHYYSRSKKSIVLKGKTSLKYEYLKTAKIDCHGNTLLFQVEGHSELDCHTGHESCFHRGLKEKTRNNMLAELYKVVKNRKENPRDGSYTNYLFDCGLNKIISHIGEECTSVIVAAKDEDKDELAFEMADLIYYLTIMLVEMGSSWEDVQKELNKRR